MDSHRILQVIMLIIGLHAQLVPAGGRNIPADVVPIRAEAPSHLATRFGYAIPMLLTYQGIVLDANSQLAEPLVVHVLMKAKILKTGSYIVRAVVNTQRTSLQGDESFTPGLSKVALFLECQQNSNPHEPPRWSALQFTLLGLLDAQGPYTLELVVPQSANTKQFRLRLFDWPMYYSLDMQKLLNHNLFGEETVTRGVFQHAIVMTHVRSGHPDTAAKILATHITYHVALGFNLYLLYTWSSDLIYAVMSNNVTAKFVAEGTLQMVSMEILHFPTYDDTRSDKSFPFHQSYVPRQNVIYNHAALTLWGELFHLAVLDVDEFFAAYPNFESVSSWFRKCYPRVHVIRSSRVDAVCEKCALVGETEMSYFSQHWSAKKPAAILQDFNRIASYSSDPKSLFWPDKVGQVWVHEPFSLPGSRSVTISAQDQLEGRADKCVYVVHLYNLFKHRIPYDPRVQKHPVINWVHQLV